MPIDMTAFAYATAVAGGGILGYIKSHSIPSLGAGLIFGSVLGIGAYQVSQDPHNYGLMLGTSAALGTMMGYRFYSTQKIMPAGLIAAMSAAMVARIMWRHFTIPNKPMEMKQ